MKSCIPILAILFGLASNLGQCADKRYGGLPLEAWRERLADFDAQSAQAAAAVGPLTQIAVDVDINAGMRRGAILALGRIGGPARAAVPALARLLAANGDDPFADAPLWAAKALAEMGPHARDAAPVLAAAARDARLPLSQRQMCLEALAQIRGAHPDAVRALIDMVGQEPSSSVNRQEAAELRSSAVEALGVAGADAAVAAPLLVRIIRNPREAEIIRRRSAAALGKMGPGADVAAEALAEAMVLDESEAVRDAAAQSLARLGPRGEAALVHFLRHDEPAIRLRAAGAIGEIANPNGRTIAALHSALGDADEHVRLHAARSLWKIHADAPPLLRAVVLLLASDDRNVRFAALELLETFGPQAKGAEKQLEALAEDERQHVRRAARQALRKLRELP